MLPSSLRKLSKAFNIENKGFFPFEFINDPSIPLVYIGSKPEYKFYEGISIEEYNYLPSKEWNLRNQAVKYCELDCRVLHQILCKFNELIFSKFTVNVHRFPTLSSVAMGIYRSSYLGDHKYLNLEETYLILLKKDTLEEGLM